MWVERFLAFHGGRAPEDFGAPEVRAYLDYLAEVRAYLDYLADVRRVSASTQNQALCGLVFYDKTLDRPLGAFGDFSKAKRPRRLPVVLTRDEVEDVSTAMVYTRPGLAVTSPADFGPPAPRREPLHPAP